MKFKSLTTNKDVDAINYIKDYCNKYKDVKIYIGTDSQTRRKVTTYVTTIVLHRRNFGCHILYNRKKIAKVESIWLKLWKEVEASIELALWLRENKIEVDSIDLDLNSEKDKVSNQLLKTSIGYIKGYNLNYNFKPEILPAIKAADNLSK